MPLSRRRFLVLLRNTAIGSFLLPTGDVAASALETSTSALLAPVRKLVSLPNKVYRQDGTFMLYWLEEKEEGIRPVAWVADDAEELQDMQRFYETVRDFDSAGLNRALDDYQFVKRSPEEVRLLQHILDHWDDHAPRVAYADWMCRNDRPEGEFVKLANQVEATASGTPVHAAMCNRLRELEERFADQMVAPLVSLGLKPLLQTIPAKQLWLDHGLLTRAELNRPGILPERTKLLFNAAPLLRELTLSYDRPALPEIAQRPEMKQIARLTLSNCRPGPDDLFAIGNSRHLSRLQILDLSGNELQQESWQQLWQSDLTDRLMSLNIRRCGLKPDRLPDAGCATFPLLRELRLDANAASSRGFEALFSADRFPDLQSLWLSIPGRSWSDDETGEELSAGCGQALARSPVSQTIVKLRFEFGLGDAGLAALCTADWPQLKTLELRLSGLTPTGLELLAEWSGLSRLRELKLTDSHIGTDGAKVLASASGLKGLNLFDVSRAQVDDEGLRFLASVPWTGNLRTLNLQGNNIGPAGVASLAASPHLTSLRELNLAQNPIGPGGAQALARSRSLSGLSELHVDANAVGTGGKTVLEARFGNEVLKWS